MSEPQFEWGKRVLATLELEGDERVMDAGCGTGRLTALLAEKLPRGQLVALDRSFNMASVARETLGDVAPHATVLVADLSSLPFVAQFDVVFSTATFHWILDHDRLFAELFSVLRPHGRLRAQCGGGANLAKLHERAHALMETADFAPCFVQWTEPWAYATADATVARLERAGFVDIDANVEAAPFVFPDAQAYRAFVSTVVLRTFLARLHDERLRNLFLDLMVEQAASDAPAFELDYWRLNIRARRR